MTIEIMVIETIKMVITEITIIEIKITIIEIMVIETTKMVIIEITTLEITVMTMENLGNKIIEIIEDNLIKIDH